MQNTYTKSSTLERIVTLYERTSKKGTIYLSGKIGFDWVSGFYITKKKHISDPDIQILKSAEANGSRTFEIKLYEHASKQGKVYYTGEMYNNGFVYKVVGFVKEGDLQTDRPRILNIFKEVDKE